MKVVNCNKEPYDVKIMRPSKWGNPFSHLDVANTPFRVVSRDEAIKQYELWIYTQPDLMNSLHELKGKTLGCCCKPLPCHGDVLLRLANANEFFE